MKTKEALNILKPVGNHLDAVKDAYKNLCKIYHPDINPNGLEMMKLINCAYDCLIERLGDWDCEKHRTDETPIDEIFNDILNKIKHVPNINIEICGTWLYVTGDTFPVKDLMKANGLRWACKKFAWYWRPEDCKCFFNKGTMTLDEIRTRYGTTEVQTELRTALNQTRNSMKMT